MRRLRLEAGRQVGVGVQRDPVRTQRGDLGDGAVERFGGLARQAVDEVDVDRREAEGAGRRHQVAHELERLLAVHRLLHVRLEVLDAQAEAVESELAQVRQPPCVDGARVDLDRQFGLRREMEVQAQDAHELGELRIAQEGRRAAAQVQLRHRSARAELFDDQRHLVVQRLEIGRRALVVAGDHLVARAVVAKRLAEGDVDVHGQGRADRFGRDVPCPEGRIELRRAEAIAEAIRGRIGGVARPGSLDAAQDVLGRRSGGLRQDGNDFGHGAMLRWRPRGMLAPGQGAGSSSRSTTSKAVMPLAHAVTHQNTKKPSV